MLALYTSHALSYRQWPVYSKLRFSFSLRVGRKRAKTCDFHTFCYVPCPYGGVASHIENRSLLYISLGFKAHSTKNRTPIAYATVENGCVKNRLLVIVSGVAMDTTSPAPEKICSPKQICSTRKIETCLWRLGNPCPANRSGSCCTIRGREGRTRDLFPTRSTGPCRVGP